MTGSGETGTVSVDFVWCSCGWIRERGASEGKGEAWARWEAHLDASHPVKPVSYKPMVLSIVGLVAGLGSLLISAIVFGVLVSRPSTQLPLTTSSGSQSTSAPPGSFTVQCPPGTARIDLSYQPGQSRCFDSNGQLLGLR